MLKAPFEGGCQCGALRYRCEADPFVAYACHCLECQHLTSSAFTTCIQVPAEALSETSGSPASRDRVADSGNRITTWFCAGCSSALYSGNAARPRVRTLEVGALDRAGDVEVAAHIWTRRRLPWVLIPPEHRDFSEMPDWRPDYVRDLSRLER
jgi:hypothetical protein